MGLRRRHRSAGQDEFLERRQFVVELGDEFFKAGDVRLADDVVSRDAHFAAEVEKIVLDAEQCVANRRRQLAGEQHAEARVELVDLADDVDAQAVLGDSRAVAQAGRSGIAGARDNFREAVAHDLFPFAV